MATAAPPASARAAATRRRHASCHRRRVWRATLLISLGSFPRTAVLRHSASAGRRLRMPCGTGPGLVRSRLMVPGTGSAGADELDATTPLEVTVRLAPEDISAL